MNALHILIVALFLGDAFLEPLFTGAGATGVEVIAEGERTTAQYPRIIVSIMDGPQHEYTDEELELFVQDGRVQIEIVCRESDTCPDPLTTAMSIKAQVQDILLGRKSKELPGLVKLPFSDGSGAYICLRCVQKGPAGKLPSDPLYERHRVSFDVTVQRVEE